MIQPKASLIFSTMLATSLLLCNCERESTPAALKDFVAFELNASSNVFEFTDSAFQNCQPDLMDPVKRNFYSHKTFYSKDNQFHSLTIAIEKVLEACPTDYLDSNSKIVFTLTQGETNDTFIDYIKHNQEGTITWSQKLDQGKIILTGNFSGWFYKFSPTRKTGLNVEPTKLDSIHIEKGEFQFTL